MIPPLL